jgi:hypothetical protein
VRRLKILALLVASKAAEARLVKLAEQHDERWGNLARTAENSTLIHGEPTPNPLFHDHFIRAQGTALRSTKRRGPLRLFAQLGFCGEPILEREARVLLSLPSPSGLHVSTDDSLWELRFRSAGLASDEILTTRTSDAEKPSPAVRHPCLASRIT